MELTDEQFREQHKPIHVPASFAQAVTDKDKVVFALAELGEAAADAVSRHLEQLETGTNRKALIAQTHQILTDLYQQGAISACEAEGGLKFNLHKITHSNDGAVDPALLAPGLD